MGELLTSQGEAASSTVYCAYSGLALGKQAKYLASSKRVACSFHSVFSLGTSALAQAVRAEIAASRGGIPHHEARLLLLLAQVMQQDTLAPLLVVRCPISLNSRQTLLAFDGISLVCRKLAAMAETERLDFYTACPRFSTVAWQSSSARLGRSEYIESLASVATGFLEWLQGEVMPRLAATCTDFTRELYDSEISRLLADSLASSKIGAASGDISDWWHLVISETAATLELGREWEREARAQLTSPNSEAFLKNWIAYLQGMTRLHSAESLVSPQIYAKAATALIDASLSIQLSTPSLSDFSNFAVPSTQAQKASVDFEIALPSSEPSTPSTQAQSIANATNRVAAILQAKRAKQAASLKAAKELVSRKLAAHKQD